MLHNRWRPLMRWTLFALVLLGLAALLQWLLPAAPRWRHAGLSLVAITPDGRSVVTTTHRMVDDKNSSVTGPLQVWDLASGKETARHFDGATGIHQCMFVRPLENTLVVSLYPGPNAGVEIHLLDLTRGTTRKLPFVDSQKVPFVFHSAKYPITLIQQALFLNSKRDAETLCLLDLQTGELLQQWDHVELWQAPIFNDHLLWFSCQSNGKTTAILWDMKDRKIKATVEAWNGIYVSGSERVAATAQLVDTNRQKVTVWDLTTGTPLSETEATKGLVQLSSDGYWALIGEVDPNQERQRAFWNLRESKRIGALSAGPRETMDGFSDNGQARLLSISHMEGRVRLLDAATLKPVWERTWPGSEQIELVVWQPAARRLGIHAYSDNGFEYLDLADGKTLRRIEFAGSGFQNARLFQSSLSEDGRLLFVAADYDMINKNVLNRCLAQLRMWWRPPGERMEMPTLNVLDLETDELLFQWRGREMLSQWQLSDDRRSMLIVEGSFDGVGVLECWDVPARRPWAWIIGVPLGVGVIGVVLRVAVRRWRKPAPTGLQ